MNGHITAGAGVTAFGLVVAHLPVPEIASDMGALLSFVGLMLAARMKLAHMRNMAALEEQIEQLKICRECVNGVPMNGNCPFAECKWPAVCPKRQKIDLLP